MKGIINIKTNRPEDIEVNGIKDINTLNEFLIKELKEAIEQGRVQISDVTIEQNKLKYNLLIKDK